MRQRTSLATHIVLVAAVLLAGCSSRPQLSRAYVSNGWGGTISAIDTDTDRVACTFHVGGRARGLRLSADGRRLYVAVTYPSELELTGEDGVVAVDTVSGRLLGRYPVGSDPER